MPACCALHRSSSWSRLLPGIRSTHPPQHEPYEREASCGENRRFQRGLQRCGNPIHYRGKAAGASVGGIQPQGTARSLRRGQAPGAAKPRPVQVGPLSHCGVRDTGNRVGNVSRRVGRATPYDVLRDSSLTRGPWCRRPFPDIAGQIEDASGGCALGKIANRNRFAPRVIGIQPVPTPIVAPGIPSLIGPPRCGFPFRFAGKPGAIAPMTVRCRFRPEDPGDGKQGISRLRRPWSSAILSSTSATLPVPPRLAAAARRPHVPRAR